MSSREHTFTVHPIADIKRARSTSEAPRLLKSGYPAHNFTREDRVKGGKRSAEVRKAKAQSHAARLREWLESDEYKAESAIVDALVTLARNGDSRAAALLFDRAYGTPAKAEPERIELDVGSSEARGVSLSEIIGGMGGPLTPEEQAKAAAIGASQDPNAYEDKVKKGLAEQHRDQVKRADEAPRGNDAFGL